MRKQFSFCYFLLFFGYGLALNAQHTNLALEKLPTSVNSPEYDEITPVLNYNGQTLYFTRAGDKSFNKTLEIEGEDMFKKLPEPQYYRFLEKIFSRIAGYPVQNVIRSPYNQDVWIAHFEKNKLTRVEHPGTPLNNALPNSICSLTPEKGTFIVLNQFLPGGGMDKGFSVIRQQENAWAFPEPLSVENYYTYSGSVNLTMSPNGEVILLSLEREDSYGQNDIYVSFQDGKGGWTEPMNLGPIINSGFSEETPTISADLKTIYFSSNRHGGLGKKDIYRSRRNSENWTDWTPPRRFISPINSSHDDSQPFFNDATGYLYFTSNRDGSADIFRVQVTTPAPPIVKVKGKVINSATGELMPAKVLYGPADLNYFYRYTPAREGTFSLRLKKGEPYKVSVNKKGFIAARQEFYFEDNRYYPEQEITIFLTPVEKNAKIHLEPIFFEQSKAVILTKSYHTLNYLLSILKQYPDMVIRVEGHTEDRGKPEDLLALSKERAESIKAYLMEKGISGDRIVTIGYGAARPLQRNEDEKSRQMNRRVEVVIESL